LVPSLSHVKHSGHPQGYSIAEEISRGEQTESNEQKGERLKVIHT